MKKDEIFLVDTNLIIYAYEIENSIRKKKSLEILEKCFKKEIVLAVSNQNLAEFAFVALKKLKLDAKTVKTLGSFQEGFRNSDGSPRNPKVLLDLASVVPIKRVMFG